jgi:hypothetical protein
MTIDPDVKRIAKYFGVDAALIQAVVVADGNILKAVQCSIPSVTTREEALKVTCRSAAHALSDFVKANHGAEFITFWGHRWAPVGAVNDPSDLNRNWPRNVAAGWLA